MWVLSLLLLVASLHEGIFERNERIREGLYVLLLGNVLLRLSWVTLLFGISSLFEDVLQCAQEY